MATAWSSEKGWSFRYPGKPQTVSPALWVRIPRSVTAESAVNSLSGTFQPVRKSFTGASNASAPSSTRLTAASAATGLEMDAAWKRVSGVTGAPVSLSATPHPRAHAMAPPSRTATLTPGTW